MGVMGKQHTEEIIIIFSAKMPETVDAQALSLEALKRALSIYAETPQVLVGEASVRTGPRVRYR